MILNPSCSVIVCRIPLYEDGEFKYSDNEEFSTDSYPNGAIEQFIFIIDQMKKNGLKTMQAIPKLDYVDNSGGGGNWSYVEKTWQIATLYGAGIMTEKEAMAVDDELWSKADDPILTEECKICFSEKPKETCENIVKRMVGECKGKFEKTLYDIIDEKYEKFQEAK